MVAIANAQSANKLINKQFVYQISEDINNKINDKARIRYDEAWLKEISVERAKIWSGVRLW